MAEFDALFFDMDGTLVENSSLMPAAFKQGFAEAGYDISIDPWRGSGRTDYEILDIFLNDFDLSEERKAEEKEKIAGIIQKIVISRVEEKGLKALPGAVDLIAKLNEMKLYPGLLTGNMEVIVEPKLKAAGMKREDFLYGGFGDHSTCRADTARKALNSASAFLGHAADPERCLVIGDTPNDIACARSIGAKALAVATGKYSEEDLQKHDPDFLLRDLSDIPAFFEIIGA